MAEHFVQKKSRLHNVTSFSKLSHGVFSRIYMWQHIENTDIVRTVYSGIFRDIQQYSVMFGHIEGTLRHIEAYLGIIETDGAIIFGTLYNLYNNTIPYSEP